MRLKWKKLLCEDRCQSIARSSAGKKRGKGKTLGRRYRSDFESDYDRVVYSKPFRRLARKTQVHPFEPNAHVHNRLTHSIEVASVGRTFARRLFELLREKGELPKGTTSEDLAYVLMTASMVHDIGNPPFGHAGEYAVREWAERHQDIVFPAELHVDSGTKADVLIFEGNAQGFRLAVRSDIPHAGYMRLTHCSLGAMVKYPWFSTDERAKSSGKFNFFKSEVKHAKKVFKKMGLYDGSEYYRHPMSFLSEAADDICYRIIDIEDAVELGIFGDARARKLFCSLLGSRYKKKKHNAMPLTQLRGEVIHRLIEEFWKVFENNYESIMRGERADDLKTSLSKRLRKSLGSVKYAYEEIFADEKKILIEIGAYKSIGRILSALFNAVKSYSEKKDLKKIPFVAKRCLELAWTTEFLKANSDKDYTWWIHHVLDFVSGLTDDRAFKISNAIEGG